MVSVYVYKYVRIILNSHSNDLFFFFSVEYVINKMERTVVPDQHNFLLLLLLLSITNQAYTF